MPDAHFFRADWGLYPVLFSWGNFQLTSYMTMIPLGFLSAWLLYRATVSRSMAPKTRDTWLIPVLALCFGAVGAKLPTLLTLSSAGWDSGQAALALTSGKTIVGGLIGGWIGVVSAKRYLGIRERRGNQFAPALALGLAFGRLGCLLQGCCYGTETGLPWAVDFGDSLLRHPTQAYEILFHLAACALLLLSGAYRKPGGTALKAYFIAYLVFRFLLEFIRVEPRLWLDLTGYQWSALIFIPILILARRREQYPSLQRR